MPEPLIALLGLIVAIWVVGSVVVPTRMWNARGQNVHEFRDDHLNALGSVAWSWYFFYGRAGWPFARIEIDDIAIRIRPATKLSAWYVPATTIPWVQVESVSPSGRGIVIRIPGQPGQMRVVLYQGSLPTELQRLGVPLSV